MVVELVALNKEVVEEETEEGEVERLIPWLSNLRGLVLLGDVREDGTVIKLTLHLLLLLGEVCASVALGGEVCASVALGGEVCGTKEEEEEFLF